MSNKQPQDIPNGIPLGVAKCTMLLLRKAIDERNRMLKLGANTPGMRLWLTPEGNLVYKRGRKTKKTRPQPLLIHTFNASDRGRIALVSRMLVWVADGNCSVLPDMLTPQELGDAYCKGFFHQIQDGAAHEKARQAVIAMTKQKLIERHIGTPKKAS